MPDGIIFIHAFPLDSSMWEPQLSALKGEVSVVAPNLPGFGGSPSAGSVMTMKEAANQVAAFAKERRMSKALICGLSMGGYVALALWRHHPDLVAGFVLANTKAEADDEAAKERRRGLATRLRAEGNGFLVESPPPLLSAGAPPELLDRVKAIIAAQPADSIAAAALGMAERPDASKELAEITVPTLVISSSGDTLIPADATKPLADGIAGARYEFIPDAGHLSNMEAAGRFNNLVHDHFQRIQSSEKR